LFKQYVNKRGRCEPCKGEAIQYRCAHLVAEYAPVAVSDCKNESEQEIAVRKLLQLARTHVNRRCLIPMNGATLTAEAILSILDLLSCSGLYKISAIAL